MPRSGRTSKERPLPVRKRSARTPREGPSSKANGSIPATCSSLPTRLSSSLRVSGSPEWSVSMPVLLPGFAPGAANVGRIPLSESEGIGGGALEAYPIGLSYHVRDYYFGERLIPEMLGKEDAPDGVVSETWEISDYRETTGTVANGPYAGRTLHDLVEEFPDELVGEGWRGPHFPLLIKFLDASHLLPVHLHPDDETAREKHGEPHGKAEAWHILWAAEGATILAGIEEDPSREELFGAFKAQDYDAVMVRRVIKPGDN